MNASENNKYRELTLWIVIFFILLALPTKLVFFQKNDFSLGKEFSQKASIRQSSIASKRGVIFDRNNNVLAEDIPSYGIGISLKNFSFDPLHINLISTNLDLDIDRLKKRLARKKTKYLVLNQKVAKQKTWTIFGSFFVHFWALYWGPFWDQIGQRGGKMSPREPSGASKNQKAAFSKKWFSRGTVCIFSLLRPPKRASRGPRRLPRGTQGAPKALKKKSEVEPKN